MADFIRTGVKQADDFVDEVDKEIQKTKDQLKKVSIGAFLEEL